MENNIQVFIFIEFVSFVLFAVFIFGGLKTRENIVNYLKSRFESEYGKNFTAVDFRKIIFSDFETVKTLFNNEKYIFSKKINLDEKLKKLRSRYVFQSFVVFFSLFLFLVSPFVLLLS